MITINELLKNNKTKILLPNSQRTELDFIRDATKQINKTHKTIFFRKETIEIVEARYHQINGQDECLGLVQLTPERLKDICYESFIPITYTENGHRFKKIPRELILTMINSNTFIKELPIIEKILSFPLPIIHNNKLTTLTQGYNKEFKSFIPANKIPIIKTKNYNINTIDVMLSEFCFASEQDKTNAIAGLITPFCRGLYTNWNSRTPLFFYHANRERAGKDYLAGITSLLYEGAVIQNPPISTGEKNRNTNDELRKNIMSVFRQGRKRIHFGNNKGHIDNAVLEDIITAPNFNDRLLGKNDNVTFVNDLDISMSGNTGITFSKDLEKRMIAISLLLETEDANARVFRHPNLHEWVLEHRTDILSVMFGWIQNWYEAGQPTYSNVVFASFPEWARIVGNIMVHNGLGNPTKENKEFVTAISIEENEDDEMKLFFQTCYGEYPDMKIEFGAIKHIIVNNKFFGVSCWDDLDDRAKATQIGMLLSKYNKTVLGGVKMLMSSDRRRDRKYYFTKNLQLVFM